MTDFVTRLFFRLFGCRWLAGTLVRVDPRYFRPTEVDLLLGDPTKIKKTLGWVLHVGFEVSLVILCLFFHWNAALLP
jgi:hypothetical protein